MEEMCQIVREYKMKMIPYVRKKLRQIVHLLDSENVTLKVDITETVMVEDKDDSTETKRQ